MTGISIPNAICKSFPVSALESFKSTRSAPSVVVQRAEWNWEGASKYSCRGVDRKGARRGQWYFFTERSPWYSASACDDGTWLASYQMQGHRLTPWVGKLQRHHRPIQLLSSRTRSWFRRDPGLRYHVFYLGDQHHSDRWLWLSRAVRLIDQFLPSFWLPTGRAFTGPCRAFPP